LAFPVLFLFSSLTRSSHLQTQPNYYCKMSSPLVAAQSALLSLLPEFRNKIYKHVLISVTSIHPLNYFSQEPKPPSKHPIATKQYHLIDSTFTEESQYKTSPARYKLVPIKPSQEFNCLKYVYKQLYAETAGLELQFNNVVFSASSTDLYNTETFNFIRQSAEQRFFAFVAPMSTSKVNWLFTITIATGQKCLSIRNEDAPDLPDFKRPRRVRSSACCYQCALPV
jgi:hypothetical protein